MEHSGSTPDEHDVTLGPGTRLGKYEVVRLLGSGGMGAVYEATHTEIGKRVAVKVLSPAIAAIPGARARFLREAQLTSSLRHPNIVDVTDMGSDGGQTYLVMEFLRGEDLAQRLASAGRLVPLDLADIMLPVCSAVVEAHKAGITHRDLKPQNIFLAVGLHAMQPKVLDFGISKGNDVVGSGSLTGTGAMIGTPYYLAPEQIMDTRSSGPQSDQYALGVILYECLTGSRPFEAENLFVVFQAIVAGQAVPPRQRNPDIPPVLEAIVLRAMSVDPKARFVSTMALGRALLPFASARMRSIWEEAFVGASAEDAEVSAAAEPRPGTPAPVTGATVPALAGLPQGIPALQVPPPVPPTAAFPSRPDSFGDRERTDLGMGRSRTRMRLVFFGILIVGTATGALLALRSRPTSHADGTTATKFETPPVAAPARPAPPAPAPPVAPPVPALPVPAASSAVPPSPALTATPAEPAAPAPPVAAKSSRTSRVPVPTVTAKPSRPPQAVVPVASNPNRPPQPPARDASKANPARRSHPAKDQAPQLLNANGAPVID